MHARRTFHLLSVSLILSFLLVLPGPAQAAQPGTPVPGGVIYWNTFLGSSTLDDGNAIAVEAGGNSYITGESWATWGNPVNPFFGGHGDTFVAKVDSTGSLVWNTFMGGEGGERGCAITVDGSGNLYVAGLSTGAWGSPRRAYVGGYGGDGFVAKLDPSGALLWNTFLGGSARDSAFAIAVDASGSV